MCIRDRIVSSAKSASVICRMWDRKYHMAPDFVVAEGPLAGGHLGFSLEQLKEYGADTDNVPATYRQDAYDQEVREIIQVVKKYEEKYEKHIPVVTAGGIYTHEAVLHQFALGAEGVQVATRFVTTWECDASPAYKDAYIPVSYTPLKGKRRKRPGAQSGSGGCVRGRVKGAGRVGETGREAQKMCIRDRRTN